MPIREDKAGEEFVGRLRRGEHAAFRELVRGYHRRLLALAQAIVGSQWAEEVVQEAWVSIYQALPKFQGRSSLEAWLYTIVRNQAFSRLRREAGAVAPPAAGESGHEDAMERLYYQLYEDDGSWRRPPSEWRIASPEEMLQEEDLRRCIEHTLTLLTSDQRAVFTLRDIEQVSLKEICNILELSNSNVRVLLHRARLRLLQVIERYQETGQC